MDPDMPHFVLLSNVDVKKVPALSQGSLGLIANFASPWK